MHTAVPFMQYLTLAAAMAGSLAFAQATTTQPPAAPTSQPANAPAAAAPKLEVAGEVVVTNVGSEPRALLRYAPTVGDKQRLLLTIKTESIATLGGGPFPGQAIPALQIAISSEVQGVTPEGDIHLSFKLVDGEVLAEPGVPEYLVERMAQSLRAINGMGGSVVLDDRGRVRQGALDIPAFANPSTAAAVKNIRTALEQLIVPLPLEPVGAGGSWARMHTSDSNPNKIKLRQTAMYEVVGQQAGELTLRVHVTQDADRQLLGSSVQGQGASIELVAHQGAGSGDAALRLAKVLPARSKVRVDSKSKLEVDLAGETQVMTLDFVLDVRAETR